MLPQATARLVTLARQVQPAGTAVTGGVAVTRYEGTIGSAAAAALPARLRRLLAPELTAVTGPVSFSAWIDGAHRFRRIVTSATIAGHLTVTTLVFSSGSRSPVISVPAARQLALLPRPAAAR